MNIAIVGHGNVGQFAMQTLPKFPDISCVGWFHHNEINEMLSAQPHCAVLCTPSRLTPDIATEILKHGIATVDSFDIHSEIVTLRKKLSAIAKEHNTSAIIAAGWDPGTDSIIRNIIKVILPNSTTYTNFGPGRSMGHSVAAKNIHGVKNALALTIPLGNGNHKRHVYIELDDNANFDQITKQIKSDPYFANDPTEVEKVESIATFDTLRHGVHITAQIEENEPQSISFNMNITNPLITAQIMLACTRATQQLHPGAYTMIEIPPICYLTGETEDIIAHLV